MFPFKKNTFLKWRLLAATNSRLRRIPTGTGYTRAGRVRPAHTHRYYRDRPTQKKVEAEDGGSPRRWPRYGAFTLIVLSDVLIHKVAE